MTRLKFFTFITAPVLALFTPKVSEGKTKPQVRKPQVIAVRFIYDDGANYADPTGEIGGIEHLGLGYIDTEKDTVVITSLPEGRSWKWISSEGAKHARG